METRMPQNSDKPQVPLPETQQCEIDLEPWWICSIREDRWTPARFQVGQGERVLATLSRESEARTIAVEHNRAVTNHLRLMGKL